MVRINKNNGSIKNLLSLILILVIAVFGSNLAAAAASTSSSNFDNGFTVSPVRSIITVNKGQSAVVPVTVENPSNSPVNVQVIFNDFVASNDESGVPRIITNNNSSLPTNSFISLVKPVTPFELQGDQQKIIDVDISVPKNALSGGYYGVVRFTPLNQGGGIVSLSANVASLFLVTVPGNLFEKLSLVQLSGADVNGNTSDFFTNGQLSVVTRLENLGNIQSAPFGTIIVKNMFGDKVQTISFNTDQGNILPQSIRKFTNLLSKRRWFGYYTITASIGYGNSGGNLIIGNASFWYLPLWFIILLLVLIVLIVILVVRLTSNYKRKKFGRRLN